MAKHFSACENADRLRGLDGALTGGRKSLRMETTPAGPVPHDSGSVLPLVLVGLATVWLLALAGFDAARFGLSAARNQVAATAALHAADSGLDLYIHGAGPPQGPLAIDAPPGRAVVTVVPLVLLPDSSRVVDVLSDGRAPQGALRPVVRRLAVLVRIDAAGIRHRVRGSWRERF